MLPCVPCLLGWQLAFGLCPALATTTALLAFAPNTSFVLQLTHGYGLPYHTPPAPSPPPAPPGQALNLSALSVYDVGVAGQTLLETAQHLNALAKVAWNTITPTVRSLIAHSPVQNLAAVPLELAALCWTPLGAAFELAAIDWLDGSVLPILLELQEADAVS